jgi:hypothetical protein
MNGFRPGDRVAYTTAKGYGMTGTVLETSGDRVRVQGDDGRAVTRPAADLSRSSRQNSPTTTKQENAR